MNVGWSISFRKKLKKTDFNIGTKIIKMNDEIRKLGEHKVKLGRGLREITKLKRLRTFSTASLFYSLVHK